MILTYTEVKEDAYEGYERLYVRAKYAVQDTFYANLNDYECAEDYTLTEEVSVYVAFALVFIEKEHDFCFMKCRLKELLSADNMKIYEEELGNEFEDFMVDVDKVKEYLLS